MSSKGLYIKTYGCQMNAYDSLRMGEAMKPLGFVPVPEPEEAQLMILNTCHIRAKAEEKLFSDLGRLHRVKKKQGAMGQESIIVVAGCVGQALGAHILKRAPYVDVVVGPQTYHTLPETITRLLWSRQQSSGMPLAPAIHLGFSSIEKFDALPLPHGEANASAFLSIQEGCNKFCRFCVVPYVRGPEYSRPIADVLQEARLLIENGAKEITLLGQNVNAYHGIDAGGQECTLGRLLFMIAEIPGLKRLRYTTSHPRDVHPELLEAHRDIDILMPLLHLPVQSGSDKILTRMNRQYSYQDYVRIIESFRTHSAEMAFSSDFIVGYPGEDEEDFQRTCDLVQEVKFAQAFSFMYSPRTGTPAALAPQIPEEVKRDRLHRLQKILDEQREAFNSTFLHQEVEVLIEKKEAHQWTGRSPYMHAVHGSATQHSVLGAIQKVRITHTSVNSLRAEIVTECAITEGSA